MSLIVIPARLESSRLPRKLMLEAGGKTILQHTYERATKAKCAERVIVATDSAEIAEHVIGFGGGCVLTRRPHCCGMDRVDEALEQVTAQVIVNVQADQPQLNPAHVDLAESFWQYGCPFGTVATPATKEEVDNPNMVKVVLDCMGYAMYFSRRTIPYCRAGETSPVVMKHIGIYAGWRTSFRTFAARGPCAYEQSEGLEQLRALYHKMSMYVSIVNHAEPAIDTAEDFERFSDGADA